MSQFDERKNAFESKYAADEESRFRVEARATKLLGLWAAQEMGLDASAAAEYATELVSFNLREPGLNDVVTRVSADLTAKGKPSNTAASMMDKFLTDAEAQIQQG